MKATSAEPATSAGGKLGIKFTIMTLMSRPRFSKYPSAFAAKRAAPALPAVVSTLIFVCAQHEGLARAEMAKAANMARNPVMFLSASDAERRGETAQGRDHAKRRNLPGRRIADARDVFNRHRKANRVGLYFNGVRIAGNGRIGPDFELGFVGANAGQ